MEVIRRQSKAGQRDPLIKKFVFGRLVTEMQRADHAVFPDITSADTTGRAKVDAFENVDLARQGPRAVMVVRRHHPDCGPGALPLGRLCAEFDLAILPARDAARADLARGKGLRDTRVGRRGDLWRAVGAGIALLAGDQAQHAVGDADVFIARRITLTLIVAATPTRFFRCPFGAVKFGAIELV